jgi:formylglycine-generating enzyme required for sulfatase activity
MGALIAAVSIAVVGMAGVAGWAVFARSPAAPAPAPSFSRAPPAASVSAKPAPPDGMVYLAPGKFVMGAAGEGKTEVPHEVTLTRGFYLDRTEVTAEAYVRCVRAGKCPSTSVHGPDVKPEDPDKFGKYCTEPDPSRRQHPINCIDRLQAEAYCQFVGKRLPTEAEWEYAARGGDARLFPWGDELSLACERANVGCGRANPRTEDVGMHAMGAAPSGAQDMAGNVWEWVADGWNPDAYKQGSATDPVEPLRGEKGILRGGAWDFQAKMAKATYRLPFVKMTGHVSTGLRCAQTAI